MKRVDPTRVRSLAWASLPVAALACSHASPAATAPAEVPVAPASSVGGVTSAAPRQAGADAPPAPETTEVDCSNDAFVVRRDAVDQAEARGDTAAIRRAIAAALVIRPRVYGYWATLAQLHL